MKKNHQFKFYCSLFIFLLILGNLFAQEIILPSITTYIDDTVIEQKQTITAEEIQSLHPESLTTLLQSQGIQILSYGSYGLQQSPSIRGFTDETVRVVIDGVCVNNEQYGTFDFSSININDIEKIEIIRGGFTEGVCDKGAVGGVIYITTKKQSLGTHFYSESQIKTFFNTNCFFDTFSQNFGFSSQVGENSFFKTSVKGVWANNQFLYKDYKGQTVEQKNSDVKDANSNIQFLHYFGNGNYFSLNDLFYIGDKNIPGTKTGSYSGNQKDLSNKLFFSLNFPAVKNSVRLENSFCWISDNRNYIEKTDKSEHYVNTFKLASSAVVYSVEKLSQSFGVTFDYTNLNSTNDGNHNQFSLTAKETSKFNFGKNFYLSVPLAFKLCEQNFAFIPKLGVGAEFSHVNLSADAYRMVQFPNMDDMYWIGAGFKGNPNLKVERGFGTDFSVSVHHFVLPFSFCVFANYYMDKIQWNLSSGMPENLASAFYAGVDFFTEKTFFDFITFNFNAEYLYNRLLDKSNNLTYGKRIMWTPDLTAACHLNFAFENFNWNVDASYTGKRYTSNLNIYFLEPYVLLNSSLEFTKFAKIVPYLRAENILNTDYEAAENYAMPGISLALGIKISK